MELFNKYKTDAINRLSEEKLYEQIAQELKEGKRREGIWVKAMSKSGGDLNKSESIYIQLRAQSIKDEHEVEQTKAKLLSKKVNLLKERKQDELVRQAEVCVNKLKNKGYKVYWSKSLDGFIVIDKRPNKEYSFKNLELLCDFSKSAPLSNTADFERKLLSVIVWSAIVFVIFYAW